MVQLTVESRWSKLCDTSGMISAVKCRSIGFGTFCNQGLFPAIRGWISSSVCKMLLHIGDAMAEWWNHHAPGGFAFFTFARCSACFSSSFTMAQPIESWCFWRLLIWVTFWVTVPLMQSWQVEVSRPHPAIGCRCIWSARSGLVLLRESLGQLGLKFCWILLDLEHSIFVSKQWGRRTIERAPSNHDLCDVWPILAQNGTKPVLSFLLWPFEL